MRVAIGPDGLVPVVGVDPGVGVDVSELLDANKPGRNLNAPNATKKKAIIKNMGGGLFLLSWDIVFYPYMISAEKLLATIIIQEISVKVNSLNSLIKLIKVIFGCSGRAGCSPHKSFSKLGCKI